MPHSLRGLAALVLLVLVSSPAFAEDIVLYAARAPVVTGAWRVVNDASAAGGARLEHPDLGVPKLASAQRTPANYFELSFTADAGVPYRLWLRGRAAGNRYTNDSVFIQFSDSVTAGGVAVDRIDTTQAQFISIEDCNGCGLANWGWQDSGYGAGVLGPAIRFASTGVHRIRIQGREDGVSIDQIVLSSTRWLNNPPGTTKNDGTLLPSTDDPPIVTTLRPPFLQQLGAGSVTIVWATREGGTAAVRYRPAGSGTWLTEPATSEMVSSATTGLPYAFVQHEAALTGLAAQTDYAYEVSVRDVTLTEGSFRTAPAAGTGQVRFAAFGDSGTGSVEQKKLAVLLSDQQPDLLLHTGDLAYQSGTLQELQDYFFGIYGGWLASRSVAPSIGNHDDVTFEAAAFLNSFVLPLNAPAGVQERYYSFDFGPAHFVALDTEHAFLDPALRAEQLSWLRADLAATTRPWKIVFFHRPPYDSGPHHAPVLDVRQAFGPVFEELGVQLVLSGHEHIYERTVPWQQSGGPGAPVYVVTGGGGGPLHQAGRAAFTAVARAAHHYVRATVTATTLTLQAVDLTGAVFDTYVLDRTTQAQDAEPPVVTFNAPSAGANVSGQVGVGVTATDDTRVEKVDLYVDGVLKASDLTAPYQFSWDASGAAAGAHTLRATAYDLAGRAASATRSVSIGGAAVPDIVLYAADAAELHGAWQVESDASAAGGRRVRNPNAGLPKVDVALASPATYFEVTFAAEAGRPYHLWLRMRADGNAYPNDSVHVQFDQSETAGGAAAWRIGTTDATWVSLEDRAGAGMSGWGWNDNGWAGMGPPVYFATSGQQRMRVQVREDGLSIDQIVISPGTYLARSPGALKNDTTILPPQ